MKKLQPLIKNAFIVTFVFANQAATVRGLEPGPYI